MLRELSKLEELAREIMQYRLSTVAVTETHLPSEGERVLDAETGYKLLFPGRLDGRNVEGVGIALSPHASTTLQHYEAVSQSSNSKVSYLSRSTVGNSSVCPDQSSVEVTEHFYSDLGHAMVNADKLTMVIGNVSASPC